MAANVAIDSISYAPDGAVQLGGHGQPEAVLRLYLDGAPLAEARLAPMGNGRSGCPRWRRGFTAAGGSDGRGWQGDVAVRDAVQTRNSGGIGGGGGPGSAEPAEAARGGARPEPAVAEAPRTGSVAPRPQRRDCGREAPCGSDARGGGTRCGRRAPAAAEPAAAPEPLHLHCGDRSLARLLAAPAAAPAPARR